MPNVAILLGISEYESLPPLPCCHDDILAIQELLRATGKYSEIVTIENAPSNKAKDAIRSAIEQTSRTEELFFYFTGHGFQTKQDFYHCAPDFDRRRPNQTGLSLNELHLLLRMAEADVVVKVVDACNSGIALVKSEDGLLSQDDKGFKTLVQFSSCLESQTSLTGHPLSVFTGQFRDAALRKLEGPVYYTDIIASLRDTFENNNSQTPYFISQGTGREQFVNDAERLSPLRTKTQADVISLDTTEGSIGSDPNQRLLALLGEAEGNTATPDRIETFVGEFFDRVVEQTARLGGSDLFTLQTVEHSNFLESSAEGFICRVMSKETRPDKFVTATVQRENGHGSLRFLAAMAAGFGGGEGYRETCLLKLNYPMPRAQLKVVLEPRYRCLKQIVLIVSCAPSLENCYIFEIGSQHSLKNFDEFDTEGEEIVRRWYKPLWGDNTDGIVDKIARKLEEAVREHLENTQQRLRAGDTSD